MRFLLVLLVATSASAATPRTFRVDYFHTGNATEERFSLDRLVLEPLPWPGNPSRPVDETNLGKYLFEVRDRDTNRLLHSRGFASIYGEWETTPEAKELNRTFSEMDALFISQRDWEEKFLGSQEYAGKVGAFEGAMYEARGYFRPQVDCVMFTRDRVPFCAVCRHSLTEIIDLYAGKPARSAAPSP